MQRMNQLTLPRQDILVPPAHLRIALMLLLAVLLVSLTAPQARASASIMHFGQEMVINELGDAQVTLRMQFNAAQYQMWQQKYGQNPSLLRRDMSGYLTAYDIADFKVERDDMEREVTIRIAANGVTRYMGEGRFDMEYPRTWRLVNQADRELKFNHTESLGGGVTIVHNITVQLPDGARDVSQPTRAQKPGMMRISYHMPVPGPSRGWLFMGLTLVLLGLAVSVAGLVLPLGSHSQPQLAQPPTQAWLTTGEPAPPPATPQSQAAPQPSDPASPTQDENTPS